MSFALPGTKSDYANTSASQIQHFFEALAEYQIHWRTAKNTTKSASLVIQYYVTALNKARDCMKIIREGEHPDTAKIAMKLNLYEQNLATMQTELENHIRARAERQQRGKPQKTQKESATKQMVPTAIAQKEPENCEGEITNRLKEYQSIEPIKPPEKSSPEPIISHVQQQDTPQTYAQAEDSDVSIEIENVQRPEDIAKELAYEERCRRFKIFAVVLIVLFLLAVIAGLLFLLRK